MYYEVKKIANTITYTLWDLVFHQLNVTFLCLMKVSTSKKTLFMCTCPWDEKHPLLLEGSGIRQPRESKVCLE